MSQLHDTIFRALADPTRRALFERLCSEREITVGALTAEAGVSQPVVSKHLKILKDAGFVASRQSGRQTHYRAEISALAHLADWTNKMNGFWKDRFDDLEDLLKKDGLMTEIANQSRTVVVERKVAFPPERVWRALTQPHLIEEWLMKNNFKPELGYRFDLSAEWGSVTCRVLEVEQGRTLSYTWDAMGLASIVTWTLSPADDGTHIRMEQTGFGQDQEQAYQGAKYGWPQFFGKLEALLARLN